MTEQQRQHIQQAETEFMATGYRPDDDEEDNVTFGNDASHRGGTAGFLKLSQDGNRIFIPDYTGNNMFNSIGNLLKDPRMGLSFPLYENGGMLQLSGRAVIHWDANETDKDAIVHLPDFNGALRWLELTIDEINELPEGSLPIRWDAGKKELQLQVYDKIQETSDVVSFYLSPIPGDSPVLPDFQAGQHLTLTLPVTSSSILSRSYSLSGSAIRRIITGFQCDGIHLALVPNICTMAFSRATLSVLERPAGDFVLDPASLIITRDNPNQQILFLSAGIGLTPILSMLHSYVRRPSENRPKALWVHSARDGRHHAFSKEVEELRQRASGDVEIIVAYTQPQDKDKGRYDVSNRLNVAAIHKILTEHKVEPAKLRVYMCGPEVLSVPWKRLCKHWAFP